MENVSLEFSKFLTKLAIWFRLMTESGLSDTALQQIIDSKEARYGLVRFWNRLGIKFPSYEQAKEIMDRNFIGLEKIKEYFGINLIPDQYFKYAQIPYSIKTLQSLRDTHILVAVFPISIFEMMEKHPKLFDVEGINSRYSSPNELFIRDQGKCQWILLNKTGMEYKQGYDCLTAQPVVYSMISYFLSTAELMFTDFHGVHVSNTTCQEGHEVYVRFSEDGKIWFYDHEFGKTEYYEFLKKWVTCLLPD